MTWKDTIRKEKKRLDMMGYNHSDSLLKLRDEIFESVNKNISEAMRHFHSGIEGFKGADKATRILAIDLHDGIRNSVEEMIGDAEKAINELLEKEFELYSSDVEGEARQEAEAERRMGEARERSAEYSSRDY